MVPMDVHPVRSYITTVCRVQVDVCKLRAFPNRLVEPRGFVLAGNAVAREAIPMEVESGEITPYQARRQGNQVYDIYAITFQIELL